MKALSTSLFAALALLVATWAGFGSTARAAETALASATGNLAVTTVNQAGKPVAGALVNVFATGVSTPAASGTTNASGKITFSGLATGTYTVFASKVTVVGGFPVAIFGSSNATVIANKTTPVTVALVNSAP